MAEVDLEDKNDTAGIISALMALGCVDVGTGRRRSEQPNAGAYMLTRAGWDGSEARAEQRMLTLTSGRFGWYGRACLIGARTPLSRCGVTS